MPEDFVWAYSGVGPEGEEEGWDLKAVRESTSENVPHSPVVKNVPNSAGEMGSVPGLRRCLMSQSS